MQTSCARGKPLSGTDHNPGDLLLRLRAALEAGVALPDEVRAWLLAGLDDFEAAGGKRPLCGALRLRGRGLRSLGTRKARRDMLDALHRALLLIECPNPHSACQLLANHIATFETRIWPRVRSQSDPPDRLDAIQRELFTAFRVGLQVPASQRQLYRELVENFATDMN